LTQRRPGAIAAVVSGRRVLSRSILVATLLVSPPARAASKALDRPHDPVIVTAAALGSLPDRHTAAWRLYRIDVGQPVPIPFQFDAVDLQGDVVVDAPEQFELKDADQLVFMARDTGNRAPEGWWPAGGDAVVEIEAADAVHGGKGWAYLVHFAGSPPAPSAERYVSYDAATHRARSAFYEVEYAASRNFFTGLRVLSGAGGDGRNLLEQTRMLGRPTFHLLLADLTLGFTEQNSIVAVEGVRTGPVRAVRRVHLSVELGRYFPELPSGTVYTYHYLTSYTTPSRMGIPWLILKALRSFTFEELIQFRPEVMPMRYWDGANREGIPWTDIGARRLAVDVDHDWWVHSGNAGTMLHAFVVPPEWRAWGIARGTVFRGGDGGFAAGYSLLNMTRLQRAGSHDLLMADVVLPGPYAPGDEEQAMAMLRAPLGTTVRPLARPVDGAVAVDHSGTPAL
jgi:hypothetical protein